MTNPTLRPDPLGEPPDASRGTSSRLRRDPARAVLSAAVELEVGFPELDPMAVAWHGHYLRYFEQARVALMRLIGYDYPDMQASGYSWPIVEAKLRYVRAARYGQRLKVTAGLEEWENRLRIGYLIVDAAGGARITTGYTVQCAVAADGELQLVCPEALRERVARLL